MTRKFIVSFFCILCLAWLFTLSSPVSGHADTTYLFTASPTGSIPGFTIEYIDTNHTGFFSLNDTIINFSGFYTYSDDPNGNHHTYHWTTITGVPPRVTDNNSSYYSPFTDGNDTYHWDMSGQHWSTYFPNPSLVTIQFGQATWIETQAPVPVPLSILLLGAGLLRLANYRRRKLASSS